MRKHVLIVHQIGDAALQPPLLPAHHTRSMGLLFHMRGPEITLSITALVYQTAQHRETAKLMALAALMERKGAQDAQRTAAP